MRQLALLLLLLLLPTVGLAAPATVELDYLPASGETVAEYRLYQNGAQVATLPGLITTDVELVLQPGDVFTATACNTNGVESPHSDPYIIADVGQVIILRIGPAQ